MKIKVFFSKKIMGHRYPRKMMKAIKKRIIEDEKRKIDNFRQLKKRICIQ